MHEGRRSSPYAQTNIQLYNQLLDAGYADHDVELVRKAYDLASELFAGAMRPNGKTFLAHLVGTACILAEQHAAARVIAAGLLHAAYTHGRFTDPRPGKTRSKRSRVRHTVGPEIEDLLARYGKLRWNEESVRVLSQRKEPWDPAEKDVMLIRLANELEDHLDLGMLYGGKKKKYDARGPAAEIMVKLARVCDAEDLAQALDRAFKETEAASIPEGLRTAHKASFHMHAPLWWRYSRVSYTTLRRLAKKLGLYRP